MEKPSKPYPDFPLFPHASGQWAKKIRGKTEYFGVWSDWKSALNKYLADRDYLQAGQTPPGEQATLADVLNSFIESKEGRLESGELTQRTFNEYRDVCDTIAETIGKYRHVDTLSAEDFTKLRTALGKGKRKQQISPVSHKRLLTFARMVFNYANEEMGKSIRYKKSLQTVAASRIRESQKQVGERLFTAEDIRDLAKQAKPQLRAMILLGINCGFGNGDCGTLPIEMVDLDAGWHRYWRPKTKVDRECPLWPETVDALRKVIGDRTEGLVFVTKYGNPWTTGEKREPIAYEFRKLVGKSHVKGVTTFYSLRRTFETIATASEVPQSTIDYIMGHAPESKDMAAIYRQKVFKQSLQRCVDYVRQWYLGKISIS